MMKKGIVIFIGLIFIAGVAKGISTRSTTYLNDLNWLVSTETSSTPIADVNQISKGDRLKASFVLDQTDAADLAFYLYGGGELFNVFVNGNLIPNELAGEDFHAEILSELNTAEIELELLALKDVSINTWNDLIQNAQIAALNNVFICHINMAEDPFFGGKMVVVNVKNRLGKDVDGKLIANVLDYKTKDLVTENNNCAFSRENSDIEIDINFPDADVLQEGKKYLLEIAMVDKEKNEEVIDQLVVPVQF